MIALTLLGSASSGAIAQVSGSVAIVSNYVYRGVSLSNNGAEPQLSVAYDNDGGWFGGMFASRITLAHNDSMMIGYAGYAQKWQNDLSWEAGVSDAIYPENNGQDYAEAFLGLSGERLNARIYYSPNYLGQSQHSVYAELNANYPLFADVQVMAHVGYLAIGAGDAETRSSRHIDRKIGIGTSRGEWNFQFAVTSLTQTSGNYYYPHVSQTYGGVAYIAYGF